MRWHCHQIAAHHAGRSHYARCVALSERHLLDALSRTPFVDPAELALILGEPHATVHRTLANLLAEGIVDRVSHGTTDLPSSQRYHLAAQGFREATETLGFDTPSDFVRAYPMSREWLTLLICRMDTLADLYRLAASTAYAPPWSAIAEAASTPPSPSTTATASAWCDRAWP